VEEAPPAVEPAPSQSTDASPPAADAPAAAVPDAEPKDEAEVEAEAAPPTATDAAPSGALEELLAAWPAIVARVSQHPPTKPLIVACRPVAVEGNVVTLGFPEEQAFLKDVAERKKTIIEQGIGESLGHAVAVRCVVANVELAAPGAAGDANLMAEARRIFADDLVDVGEIT
ncbi:MAG TPA: hypothetical protein VD766_11075, partial [Solirubrobacterales bacterium]|nr:hypothetical protein [Solirubrobacterales bacterium]